VLHSEVGVTQSTPTKLPAKPGPVFLPLDTSQREIFPGREISQKHPQHAQRKQAPQDQPWFWTITAREYPTTTHNRGYSATREQAMADFKAQRLARATSVARS
jgi:hypothetical protein